MNNSKIGRACAELGGIINNLYKSPIDSFIDLYEAQLSKIEGLRKQIPESILRKSGITESLEFFRTAYPYIRGTKKDKRDARQKLMRGTLVVSNQ